MAKRSLSQRHEEEVASALAGFATPGSGSVREELDVWTGEPGDPWRLMVSCKSTVGKGVRITDALWREVAGPAELAGLRPAFAPRIYAASPVGHVVPVRVDGLMLSLEDAAELLGENRQLRAALAAARPGLEFLSVGRSYRDATPYPDASARLALGMIHEVLGGG